jgi:jumonji domain-containing protein 7
MDGFNCVVMKEELGEERNGTLDPMTELLSTYNELNSSSVDELTEVPSALEFMRYVARNRPFVVRGGASEWEATKTWKVSVLKQTLQGQSVNVAVTLKGYAGSYEEELSG